MASERKNITVDKEALERLHHAQNKLSNQLGWRVTLSQTIQHITFQFIKEN